jgi:hypothetical protein
MFVGLLLCAPAAASVSTVVACPHHCQLAADGIGDSGDCEEAAAVATEAREIILRGDVQNSTY